MSKNRIIPQMFDVRPVDETGDLDWDKINSIGSGDETVENFDLPEQEKIKANAYILGVPVDSENAPIFHDPEFNINKITGESLPEIVAAEDGLEKQIQLQQKIAAEALARKQELERLAENRKLETQQREKEIVAEKERREKERLLVLEIQKREIQKQKEILEKLQQANREKEQILAAERAKLQTEREEKIKQEAFERKEQLQKIAEFNRVQQLDYEENVIADRKKKQQEYDELLKQEALEKKKSDKANSIWWFAEDQKEKRKKIKEKEKQESFNWKSIFATDGLGYQFNMRANVAAFLMVATIFSLTVGGISYASKGIALKGKVLGVSQDGYANLTGAMSEMAHQNFNQSNVKFSEALDNFSKGSEDVEEMGSILVAATRYIPFASKVSSGKNALEAGAHFSKAGKDLNEVVKISSSLKDGGISNQNVSLLDILQKSKEDITDARNELNLAQVNLNKISVDDLPQDKQGKFMLLKEKMPDILAGMNLFLDNENILSDLLGGNGPRKYLFLFQNNTEMRATGGFIGSYGLLDISNGHVKKFFIDGIFNPDGQLHDRIVPPTPIQKISANWSMHDSNWFADFPSSAKKAIYFYEKTGGPTADGVITLTPTVLQKLLKITGPINMPDYDVTLDSDNFIELTQYEVEVDYDKEENKPKKILSDLAPIVMEKLLSSKDLETISKTADALLEGLGEKHILLYSQNNELEKMIAQQGWSGEILPANKDYLSVVNTNINGFKTDAVVKESISHKAEIQSDGSIIDTVSVSRKHEGGSSHYEWLNKVNADYMRIYVPEGSKLLEVSGQTRETVNSPVDYDELGFKRDEDIQKEENSISIDEASGTRIYSENKKTVFGNWVYVSPGESVTVTYKYELPFKLFQDSANGQQDVDSYSLVAQKQSGSAGSQFEQTVNFPEGYRIKWNFPEDIQQTGNEFKTDTKLNIDRFVGLVFENQK